MFLSIFQLNLITTITNTIIVIIAIIVYHHLKRVTVSLKGRTALITGGASGIGLATAKAFAKIGMNIIIWDKNRKNLEATRRELLNQLQSGYYLIQQQVDITSKKQIEAAHIHLNKKLSELNEDPVSVIINNAGIVYKHSLEDMNLTEVDNVFSVNTLSVFYIIHTFFSDLKNQRVSNIVNIASLISFLPAAHLSSYSASKAATRAMTDCLRLELKASNNDHIRVCTVAPQFVDTGMFKGCYSNEFLGHRLKNVFFPMNSAEEIADEIVYAITHERDEVVLPRVSKVAMSVLNLIPHVITDYLFMFVGGSHGMDTFEGRGKEWNHSAMMEREEEEFEGSTMVFCSNNSFFCVC